MTETPATQIVKTLKRLYDNAMTSTSGGNLSVKGEDGCVYITPSAIDKGSLTEDDIVKISPDGTVTGKHIPSIEHRFHLAVYTAREDVNAVLHAHSPSLVAYAAANALPDTHILPQFFGTCGIPALINYAVPGSKELSDNVTAAFAGGASCAVMANHGAIAAASDMESAFKIYETLDRAAEIEMNACILGTVKSLSQKHLTIHRLKSTPPATEYNAPPMSDDERRCRETMTAFVKRAYRGRMMTDREGAFSMRLPDGAFIITPKNISRQSITPDDFVRVENNKSERGKEPSNSYPLHAILYANNSDWNCVMIAEPPTVMAYAVSNAEYALHAMSESEMILKKVPKYPFGSTFMQPELLARELNEDSPVAIIENDCVITGGKTPLSAFDRMEVLSYGARSLINAASAKMKITLIK